MVGLAVPRSVLVCILSVCLAPAGLRALDSKLGVAADNGDVNGDLDRDLSDGIYLLGHLFLGGPAPVPLADCGLELPALANGDANADATLDVSDSVRLLAWLFSGGDAPVDACDTGSGGHGFCRPYVAPPWARVLGRTLAEWLEIYWRWYYSGADPADSMVGKVKLLPIPAATQIGGSGTPDDPAILQGEIELTLRAWTPFVTPLFAWIAERYDPALGIPDDPTFPDDVLLAGVSPNLTINGCPVVSDRNERRFYVPATDFDPIIEYAESTSYGSVAALKFQGCGIFGLPLPPGRHVIRLYEPYIIDALGFSFGVIYDNTWIINVTRH
jgi:hypothetical protein